MKIAIFGVGGVGGFFGGKLAQADHDVAFIARGNHLAAIRRSGLLVRGEAGNFLTRPTAASDSPAEIGPVDLVIVAVKAWQIPDAAQAMRPLIGPNTTVLPLLNGVEAPDQLQTHLTGAHVLGGFCRVQSYISAPGEITQGGTPPFIALGEMDGQPTSRVGAVQDLLTSAGIDARTPPSIQAAMWQKLIFISAFGGIGALTRMPVGVMRNLPQVRKMLISCMTEAEQVALARGLILADDAVARAMALIDSLAPEGTASMQRDILSGYPSELEAQNGAVVRFGHSADVPTPTHRIVYNALLPQEQIARGELDAQRL